MGFKQLFTTAAALLICGFLFAQPSDDSFWAGVSAKIKLNKKMDVTAEQQFRFDQDYSHFNTSVSEASLAYELTDRITAKTGFRYYYNPDSHNRFRYSGDLNYSWSEKGFPLRFKYRIRFQNTTEEHTKENSAYLRNRFTVEYNLSKIADPYAAYEPYFKLNYINRFTVNRFYAGMEWKLLKDLDLDTYFMYESEYGEKNPKISRVIGLGLTYSFKL